VFVCVCVYVCVCICVCVCVCVCALRISPLDACLHASREAVPCPPRHSRVHTQEWLKTLVLWSLRSVGLLCLVASSQSGSVCLALGVVCVLSWVRSPDPAHGKEVKGKRD
jgi:hypothetical protein